MRDDAPKDEKTSCIDHDCRSGKRNRFFRGKVMGAAEFEVEQRYSINRRRLVNQTVVGWGVVAGLPLKGSRNPHEQHGQSRPEPIGVGPGFALDRHGRELVLGEGATISAANAFVLERAGSGGCQMKPLDSLEPGLHVLSVHYAERRVGDAKLPDVCGCDPPEKKFVCETVVFSFTPLEKERCPCAEGRCDRECRCPSGSTGCPGGRGPHDCLCQWVAHTPLPGEPPGLCEWKECWVDPRDPVGLGCVVLVPKEDKCGPNAVGWIENDCSPRRLVKSNDLLYDLIRGCDLTHIQWVSWEKWHRVEDPVSWEEFARQFHPDGTTEFVVRFSGPVLVDTLRVDTVVMTAITLEQATGWFIGRRVPITKLDPTPHQPDSTAYPPETTNQLRLVVSRDWVRDEVEPSHRSWLTDREFVIEIQIRGDLILDCHRQAVDADAIGLTPAPSGNGTPGGTYLSAFKVRAKPSNSSADAA